MSRRSRRRDLLDAADIVRRGGGPAVSHDLLDVLPFAIVAGGVFLRWAAPWHVLPCHILHDLL